MIDDRLAAHLRSWLGRWPGTGLPPTVVGWPPRDEPGWDGGLHRILGVTTPEHGVLSVPAGSAPAVEAWLAGVFRWCTAPAALPDAGEWVAADDPSVPQWLRPFGGEVLVAVDGGNGQHLAGVGLKKHDAHGHELAVVTTEAARGRGLARRLVAQAARRVLDEGAVPTYVHARSNTASARVATAAGFPDLGWSLLGVDPE